MKTLIIGYGSTLRRDDGVGYMLAEGLMETMPEDVVIARQLLTPDLAEPVSQSEQVIFIDACAKTPPGEVGVRQITPKGENWGAFVHEMSPEVLLDCVKDIYGQLPQAWLITIGGEDFSIGEGLSAKVASVCPQVLREIDRLYRREDF